MATLISYVSSVGDRGQCDAKCYDAQGPDCDCICGGANHGKGREQAEAQTRALCAAWMEAYRQAHAGEQMDFESPLLQRELFREGSTTFVRV